MRPIYLGMSSVGATRTDASIQYYHAKYGGGMYCGDAADRLTLLRSTFNQALVLIPSFKQRAPGLL